MSTNNLCRIVLWFAVVAALVWWCISAYPSHINATSTTTYRTQPGDTVWSVAAHYDTVDSTPLVVQWIDSHNDIGTTLKPDRVLIVPVKGMK